MGSRTIGTPHRNYDRVHCFDDNPIESKHRNDDIVRLEPAGAVERYYFRFTSPTSAGVFADSERFDNRANRSFLARLYCETRATNQVAIIFNGLDETIEQFEDEHDLFSFYDELGIALASNGVLAILLPTPYHMNRMLAYKVDRCDDEIKQRAELGEAYIDLTVPTNALIKNNFNIYRNHFQGFKELVSLCRCLRGSDSAPIFESLPAWPSPVSHGVATLFRDSLHGPLRIALIGYSLGGLRALTEYVRDWHDALENDREPIFASCVAMNSGGALYGLPNPPWVDPVRWRGMIDDLVGQRLVDVEEKRFRGIPDNELKEAERHSAFLEDVFLGQAISLDILDRMAPRAAKGMLFVLGGSDDLAPLESLKRLAPSGGLNVFQVSGMGHLFPYDEAWGKWKKVVFDLISGFVETIGKTSGDTRSGQHLAEFVSLLDHELGLLHYQANTTDDRTFANALAVLNEASETSGLAKRVLGANEFATAQQALPDLVDRLDSWCSDYLRDLLEDLHILIKRKRSHPRAYKRARRDLLFGSFLVGNSAMVDAWEKLPRQDVERLGEALVRLGVASSDLVNAAGTKQASRLESIRHSLREEFVAYVRGKLDLSWSGAAPGHRT